MGRDRAHIGRRLLYRRRAIVRLIGIDERYDAIVSICEAALKANAPPVSR